MTTANSLTAFTFQTCPNKGPNHKHSIRVVTFEGEPWFVGSDVCKILGISNTTLALNKVNASETQLLVAREHPMLNIGRAPCVRRLISESGLYKLIMRSDKREAQAFQDWVTCDVIPTIRKTGSYGTGPVEAARELVDRIEKLEDKTITTVAVDLVAL